VLLGQDDSPSHTPTPQPEWDSPSGKHGASQALVRPTEVIHTIDLRPDL